MRLHLTFLTLGFARGFYSHVFLHFGYLRLSAIFQLNATMSSHSLNVEPVQHIEILNVSTWDYFIMSGNYDLNVAI